MKLLVLILLILQGSAQDFHKDIKINACSDSEEEREFMYGLDEEVVAYGDFDKQEMVYPQPEFVDRIEFPGAYEQAVASQAVCRANLQFFEDHLKDEPLELDPPGAPLLYPRDHLRPSQPNTLVCQASGFYPAPVNFTWTRDRLNISSSSVSQAFPQSDGTFTQFSTIEVLQPEEGQVYSCSLEHPALKERATRLWTVQFQRPSLAPSVFCAVGLTLGLVGVALGIFFLIKANVCRCLDGSVNKYVT